MSRSTQSLIAQFEQIYDQSPSSLDRFLSQYGPLDRSQIQTLMLWQQSQSWRHGKRTRTEEFLDCYPALFTDGELVLDLIYSEYLLNRKIDPTITLEQFSQRFPNYADQLRQQVEFHEGIGGELIDDWLDNDNEASLTSLDSAVLSARRTDLLPSHEHDKFEHDRNDHAAGQRAKRIPQLSIPGYRILCELGRGGLAVVYLAEDLRLHRRVALKMLLAGKLASEAVLRRMQVEGEAIARLQHPHIVQIFEVGQHEEHSYLALEYANSGTLAQWMRRRPQPPRLAARLVGQLARTVQFAHDKGILHRDLKPGNVLLHDLNLAGHTDHSASVNLVSELVDISHLQLKIADFGLAKFINDDSHERHLPAAAATMTGDLLGTAAYMSPEQAKGSANSLTAATDIYSLGAVLYELLTGRPPFVGTEPLEMLSQVMLDDPVRPSDLVTHVPRDLETICLKCLHKNPERRYATADELADEIDRYLSNQPIKARRTSAIERGWRWCRRHPAKASSLVFLATLFLLVMAGLVQYSEIMRERLESISIANDRERTLRSAALERLFESHLSRASALLTSQQVGQRFASLDALDEARRMSESVELSDAQRQRIRNGVLAALALPDIQYHPDRTIHCQPAVYAFAMDGQQRVMAVPTSVTQVTLFDVKTTASLMTIDTQQTINRLALNQDASLLAVVGEKLRVFDLSSQPPICKLEIAPDVFAFATDNPRELIIVDKATVAKRLSVDTAQSTVLCRSVGRPQQIALAPDGRFVAIWTVDRVEVFDSNSGQLQLRLPPPIALDSALVWNESSTTLAVGPYPNGIELWDLRDKTKLVTVPLGETSSKFCFDTVGSRLLVYSRWGSYVNLFNLTTGECEFTQKNMQLFNATASPAGFQLWQLQAGNELAVASIVTPPLFKELPSVSRASAMASNVFVAYNQDGTIIAFIKAGTLELFEAASLKLLGKVVIGSSYVRFDPSDNLITLNDAGILRWPKHVIRSTAGGAAKSIEFGPPEKLLVALPLAPFGISRDGKLLGVSDGQSVHLWSILHGRMQASLPHADVRRLAFSPDNQLCATGGWNTGNVIIWNSDGEKVKQIDDSGPCLVRFSGDGQWLAIASTDVSVWSTRDWKLAWRREVMGRASSGMTLCFSPDSQQLAVSDAMGKIHLLEVLARGQQYAEITSPLQDQILDMVFSPDGKQLAIQTYHSASIWNLTLLRDELASRELDWDRRIEKYFNWQTEEPELCQESATSIGFSLDEEARQREAREQAVRVDAAVAGFDYQSAQGAIARAFELQLDDPTACNDLAWRLVTGPIELRDADRAMELIQRAINHPKLPEDRRAIYLNTLGVVQYRAGQFDEAFETLSQSLATQKPKDQPHDLYFLSMCAAQQGNLSMAKDFFDKAELLRDKYYSSTRLQWSRELEEFSREARGLLK